MVDNLNLQNIIYTFRGEQVMLDSDLAALYGVEVKRLNQAVKRNSERFPEEFCFQLDDLEVEVLRSQDTVSRLGLNRGGENLRSQNVTSSLEFNRGGENLRSQNVTSSLSEYGGRRYRPYVFTEQGVAMLSAVLKRLKVFETKNYEIGGPRDFSKYFREAWKIKWNR